MKKYILAPTKNGEQADAAQRQTKRESAPFAFPDTRPAAVAQRRLQAMADGHVSDGARPVQAKFIGKHANALLGINTGLLDPGATLYFTKFRKELEDSKTDIIVHDGGDTSYDQNAKALSINPKMLDEIGKFNKQLLKGKPEDETAIDGKEIVSYISTIAHELSHARDHIVLGKDISATTLTVIESELKAWAVEAVDAIAVSKAVKDMDAAKGKLVDSWAGLKKSMLDDLWANGENEVAARLLRYIVRGIKNKGKLEVNEWIGENREALEGFFDKYQKVVTSKL